MPDTGWLWAPTHISATTLVGTSTNDIGNYTRQSDMSVGRDWLRPGNAADLIDDDGEVVDGTNGYRFGYGGAAIKWSLHLLTPKMVAYVLSTNFPGGVWSHPATIAVPFSRSIGASAKYYQCIATRTKFSEAELVAGGLDAWVIEFSDVGEIAAPP